MVIGNGMIANAFKPFYQHDESVLIFASGVSNSQEADKKEYLREITLLTQCMKNHPDKRLIYFSTCGIYYHESYYNDYIRFKLMVEPIVKLANKSLVIRLPNIVGTSPNPNTLINYFYNKIKNEEPFVLFKGSVRNLLGIDDAVEACRYVINNSYLKMDVIPVQSPCYYTIGVIVAEISRFLNKTSKHTIKTMTDNVAVNPDIIATPEFVKKVTDVSYLSQLLKKYYGNQSAS